MLTDIVLGILIALLRMTFFILPDVSVPAQVTAYFHDMIINARFAADYFPLSTLLWALITVVTVELSLWSVKIILMVVSYMRGSGALKIN